MRSFPGIPFATASRFGAPVPAPLSFGGNEPGPAAPQPPSRLERVMGSVSPPQSEDCLTLNVWSPEGAEGLPVLVFFHGGGYSSGSGGLPWYDGARLAEHGIVVVTANYRLGALGFAYLASLADGLGAGNFGLQDTAAALRWVREHISAFGGDPSKVTAAGQSAGAYSLLSLLPREDLFAQAILMSTPAGMPPARPEEATETTELLLSALGVSAAELPRVDASEIIAAQQKVAQVKPGVVPPFQLVGSEDPVVAAAESKVRILLTATKDEGLAFGPEAGALTEEFFVRPARRFVDLLAANGNEAEWFEFDWAPECSPFGACHCIDLPFFFGTLDAFRDAPMLAGASRSELEDVVGRTQARVVSFVRG
ncbi:carboxylesterase family protein [Amycolatopsis acidicola]|uniref:Carboxylesterase family protein n=1 Tax=Amycolatopsis acidicola TaxID=2596893 RepID=A0A5N0UW79_9PSEU|nr:carboxylesterase family protein [Amycolatopsis acidicola]KAA9153253.1 carboxylesterase family protein [Amycolatopsis acidicola]